MKKSMEGAETAIYECILQNCPYLHTAAVKYGLQPKSDLGTKDTPFCSVSRDITNECQNILFGDNGDGINLAESGGAVKIVSNCGNSSVSRAHCGDVVAYVLQHYKPSK